MQKKGTDWVLPDADDFPVLNQNVSDLLESIAEIRDNRLVTNTSASHKRLSSRQDYLENTKCRLNHRLYITHHRLPTVSISGWKK